MRGGLKFEMPSAGRFSTIKPLVMPMHMENTNKFKLSGSRPTFLWCC